MDEDLKRFNRTNAHMGIIVDDLKMKQDAKQKTIKLNSTKKRSNETTIKSFKKHIEDAVKYIDNPQSLKQKVTEIFEKFLKDKDVKTVVVDPDIQKEYESQKTYLQNSVTSLKKKKNKDKETFAMSNQTIMSNNMALIDEINTLRKL